jgi:hypothetical protein
LTRRAIGRKAANSYSELREICGIPDVGEAVLTKQATIEDILKLAASRDGAAFLEWFHNNCRTDTATTAREYVELLRRIPKVQSTPAKILRFIVTAAIGLIPGVGTIAGSLAGALDSFVIDRIARGGSPKYLIDKLSQVASPE